MLVARMIAYGALGAAILLTIHRLSSGGYDHYWQSIITGALIGLFGGTVDVIRKRRRTAA